MHTSASGEPLGGRMAASSVTMPGDSGILVAKIRGLCEQDPNGRHVETEIPYLKFHT